LDVAAALTARVTARATAGLTWQSRAYYANALDSRRGAATATIGVGRRLSLYFGASRTLIERRWATGAFASLGVTLGPRSALNVSIERERGVNRTVADVQRALPYGTGYGYHVQTAAGGASTDLDAELRAQSSFGRFAARQTVVDGQNAALFDASGALVVIGGGVHATRPVQDGFALVRVPGVRDVRTYLSNQEVGRTGRHGDVVIPGLLPYYGNRLSIADSDVPIDRDLQRNEMVLATPYRGGALALFPAPRPWRVSGRVVLLRGTDVVIPANGGLTVTTATGPIESSLGSDGAYYFEGLPPGDYTARLEFGGETCDLTLHVPPSNAPVIKAAVATCSVTSRADSAARP
jgi:outer membrane usher protein